MLSEVNSPFTGEQAETLNRLLAALNPDQRVWLSGYLAGVSARRGGDLSAAGPASPGDSPEVAILYATETGNARKLAVQLKGRLEAQGWRTALHHVAEYRVRQLAEERIALFISSTHGEGDPPEPARPFMEMLNGRRAPRLERLQFAVLALGDSSYKRFCQTGRELDARLEQLGARRLHPRQDCDVDFAAPAAAWMDGVLEVLKPQSERQAPAALPDAGPLPCEPLFSRSHPYPAEVLENLVLNDQGSTKETHHLELLLEGSGLVYAPGDALGVFPCNPSAEVAAVLTLLKLDAEAAVAVAPGVETPLGTALAQEYELARLTPPVVARYAALAGDGMAELLKPEKESQLREYLQGRGVSDLLQDFPLTRPLSATELVGLLRRMPPRLYSIASSLKAHPGEVHLTVALARFQGPGQERLGLFSRQCREQVELGGTLPVFVQENPDFRLPEEAAAPVVMIGAGTGVAPFRAFLEEREESGTAGPTWLFFGERQFRTDFLYQVEWQRWLQRGVLSRMDVAFSRDSGQKVYVQDRLRERSRDLFAWLEQGAHVYVCGDEKRLAPGVHEALLQVVQEQGGKTREKAATYLEELKAQRRYKRDVY